MSQIFIKIPQQNVNTAASHKHVTLVNNLFHILSNNTINLNILIFLGNSFFNIKLYIS